MSCTTLNIVEYFLYYITYSVKVSLTHVYSTCACVLVMRSLHQVRCAVLQQGNILAQI